MLENISQKDEKIGSPDNKESAFFGKIYAGIFLVVFA
jgi:hypothetical protein